jgi:hypothetical protein
MNAAVCDIRVLSLPLPLPLPLLLLPLPLLQRMMAMTTTTVWSLKRATSGVCQYATSPTGRGNRGGTGAE